MIDEIISGFISIAIKYVSYMFIVYREYVSILYDKSQVDIIAKVFIIND